MTQRLLLQGYDTIECAYYLAFDHSCLLNFEQLTATKEALRQLKIRKQKPIKLGNEEFCWHRTAQHSKRLSLPD